MAEDLPEYMVRYAEVLKRIFTGERDQFGGYGHRDLPDGRTIHVIPLSYGRARIGIGPTGEQWFDDVW